MYSVVCIKHFDYRFIIHEDGAKRSGSTEHIKEKKEKKLSREMLVRIFIKCFITYK